jgi:hypothetical protein
MNYREYLHLATSAAYSLQVAAPPLRGNLNICSFANSFTQLDTTGTEGVAKKERGTGVSALYYPPILYHKDRLVCFCVLVGFLCVFLTSASRISVKLSLLVFPFIRD